MKEQELTSVTNNPAENNLAENNPAVSMTPQEKEVMSYLVNFWNAYLELPDLIGAEYTMTIRDSIHVIQGILAVRVARRVNPEIWR